jgi:hypothetical protein
MPCFKHQLEKVMDEASVKIRDRQGERGLGLMEVIVGALLGLILASVLLHLAKLGFAMYTLNGATREVAIELEKARATAMAKNEMIGVIFDSKLKKFGVDHNGNGKLESGEAAELPDGVTIAEDGHVIFTQSGNLSKTSKQPQILISNARNTKSVSVSSHGAIQID